MANQYGEPDPSYQRPYGQPPGAQPGYGQPYGPGQPGYGQPYGTAAPPYAGWLTRVGAYVVDALPGFVLAVIGDAIGRPAIGLIFNLAALGFTIWNRWLRAGRTGQSVGKSVLNIRLISEQTGQPIGGGMAFLRDLAHIVDAIICYIGFLFPLWDEKRQTLADKMVKTVVVRDEAGDGYPVNGQAGYGRHGHPHQPGAERAHPQQPGWPQQPGSPDQGYSQRPGWPQQPGSPDQGYPQQPGWPQQGNPPDGDYGPPPR